MNKPMNNAYYPVDTMLMLWLTAVIFTAAGLWFFPLVAAVYYDGKWHACWLPRVCCGFASPRRLSPLKKERQGASLLSRLPRRFSLVLGRELLSRLRVIRFRFYLAPGRRRLLCIAGITLGHIIISIARAAALYRRRLKRS